MILILTEDKEDSVNLVIDWLIHNNFEFIRINENDYINQFITEVSKTSKFNLVLNNVKFSEIASVWIRKGTFNYRIPKNNINQRIQSYLFHEWNCFSNYLIEEFKYYDFEVLGTSNELKFNKLINLKVALNAGLLIPKTLITNFINQETKSFFNADWIVSKAIQDVFTGKLLNKHVGTYAESINLTDNQSNDFFYPTCLQNIIKKRFDLRVFFLNFDLYAFAIFSNSDNIDHRKGNRDIQRIVPFNLPKSLINKVRKFIKNLDINTGSIDFVYSLDRKFYFLEVNPEGQFGRLSYECNYYLEKKIADYLCFQKRN